MALPALTLLTGCQVEMGGVTLPSPYYLTDDVQYYVPGPEYKLANEAAAAAEQAEAIRSQAQPAGVSRVPVPVPPQAVVPPQPVPPAAP